VRRNVSALSKDTCLELYRGGIVVDRVKIEASIPFLPGHES